MAQTKHKGLLNGIDVDALMEKIAQMKADPSQARFVFRAHNRWHGGTHNGTELSDFEGLNLPLGHEPPFHLECDEPQPLGGDDHAPNPVEYILHALAGCLTTTMVAHSASRGIAIESCQTHLEGDLDVQGFLGLSDKVRKGYREIHVTMRVKSDVTARQLEELARYSPVFNTLTDPPKIVLKIEKEP